MAEHNFLAGMDMTLSNVVNKYLRWFDLQRCKKALRTSRDLMAAYMFAGGSAGFRSGMGVP